MYHVRNQGVSLSNPLLHSCCPVRSDEKGCGFGEPVVIPFPCVLGYTNRQSKVHSLEPSGTGYVIKSAWGFLIR